MSTPPRPDEDDDAPWWVPLGGDIEQPPTVSYAVGSEDDSSFWTGFVVGWGIGFVMAMAVLGILTYYAVRLVTQGG